MAVFDSLINKVRKSESLQDIISKDQAYLFVRQIPGSPPYWQKFMYEGSGYGQTAWHSNLVYDFIVCSSAMARAFSNYC